MLARRKNHVESFQARLQVYLYNLLTYVVCLRQDLEMYHEESDTAALVRTMALNEELGQVCSLVCLSVCLSIVLCTSRGREEGGRGPLYTCVRLFNLTMASPHSCIARCCQMADSYQRPLLPLSCSLTSHTASSSLSDALGMRVQHRQPHHDCVAFSILDASWSKLVHDIICSTCIISGSNVKSSLARKERCWCW